MIGVSVIADSSAGTVPIEMSYFPCGERKLTIQKMRAPANILYDQLTIRIQYESDQDLIDLLLLKDAIERCSWLNYKTFVLLISYFPYGRQDRVANAGEPHSLRVIGSLINSCGFDKVFVVDPHSDVIEGVIDNFEALTMDQIVYSTEEGPFDMCNAFVSPDAGAYKKVLKAAQAKGVDLIRADKIRDTMTGDLSGFEVYAEDLTGLTVTILDDICDGGGTFIGLAKKLREKGAERILLYVTHGKFTKGVDILLEHIDEVWCYEYTGPKSDQGKVFTVELFRD
ncbi:MAG: putative ribose-phosphate pyrophosphokinase [Prokaryotic dsDNA virus sp.]|jgi:ribose-phosphate pyrophosphokinase|nr:MAG: putative ribose-phosphate pyrophosphokinase [Prokaryotic dsDNA virus sp.]|tara:strand:+ start:50418 stop:51266 length:849 start_codon:yes stop_codon:yes gene_type:complete